MVPPRPLTTVPFRVNARWFTANRWYQVGHIPNAFQSSRGRDVTADYALLPRDHTADGDALTSFRIDNAETVIDENGRFVRRHAIGVAHQVCASDTTRYTTIFTQQYDEMTVRAVGQYWILTLEPSEPPYNLAIIGEPTRKRLWILFNYPTISEQRYTQALARVQQHGYRVNDVVRTYGTRDVRQWYEVLPDIRSRPQSQRVFRDPSPPDQVRR